MSGQAKKTAPGRKPTFAETFQQGGAVRSGSGRETKGAPQGQGEAKSGKAPTRQGARPAAESIRPPKREEADLVTQIRAERAKKSRWTR